MGGVWQIWGEAGRAKLVGGAKAVKAGLRLAEQVGLGLEYG